MLCIESNRVCCHCANIQCMKLYHTEALRALWLFAKVSSSCPQPVLSTVNLLFRSHTCLTAAKIVDVIICSAQLAECIQNVWDRERIFAHMNMIAKSEQLFLDLYFTIYSHCLSHKRMLQFARHSRWETNTQKLHFKTLTIIFCCGIATKDAAAAVVAAKNTYSFQLIDGC